MTKFVVTVLLLAVVWLAPALPVAPATAQTSWKLPPVDQFSWQWQIDGKALSLAPAKIPAGQHGHTSIYDIDYQFYSAQDVANLHALGQYVIAYMDVGAWESYRPDAGQFPAAVIGKNTGWNGEKYLDIRPAALAQYRTILEARFDLAKSKGFDAVEGDYQNNIYDCPPSQSGCFPVTQAEQFAFNQWFIQAVHARGLAAILKNAPELAAVYATWPTSTYPQGYDGALNEQCHQYQECDGYRAFTKPTDGRAPRVVLNAEYKRGQTESTICPKSAVNGLNTVHKPTSLPAAIDWSCR